GVCTCRGLLTCRKVQRDVHSKGRSGRCQERQRVRQAAPCRRRRVRERAFLGGHDHKAPGRWTKTTNGAVSPGLHGWGTYRGSSTFSLMVGTPRVGMSLLPKATSLMS